MPETDKSQHHEAHDLVVAMDYGQFSLWTDAWDPDDLDVVALIDAAQAGANIAQERHCLLVLCPHQNNFEMPLRLELWSGPPAPDLDAWQEAYEAHLSIGEAGLRYGSPTLEETDLPVPPGQYHTLITGRGFVQHGWPGSTTPGDEWRIRLWPSGDPLEPRRLRAWDE